MYGVLNLGGRRRGRHLIHRCGTGHGRIINRAVKRVVNHVVDPGRGCCATGAFSACHHHAVRGGLSWRRISTYQYWIWHCRLARFVLSILPNAWLTGSFRRLGPISANVTYVLLFCLLARLADTPRLRLTPSPTRCELTIPPSTLVEYIEMERWSIPRAFLERF